MTEKGRTTTGWRYGLVISIVIVAFALQYYYPVSEKQLMPSRSLSAGIHNAESGKWVAEYLKCGHTVIIEDNMDADRLRELLQRSPDIRWRQSGQTTVLVSTRDDYCPADGSQRYMGVWEDYLAIFKGPAGNGELERITQIRVDKLPLEWQEQLLEGKLVFENELLLLEALDSLDEYQS
ncbi:MAG: hypothetical protein GX262_08885 [Clostridia bacterium]|jgi:hypothetical protein|nr:hypothetical protein [Clostridia bacterium]